MIDKLQPNKPKKGLWSGSSTSVPAWQVGIPVFNPQYCQKKPTKRMRNKIQINKISYEKGCHTPMKFRRSIGNILKMNISISWKM
jgi:hypothetical protein